jgi:hypothetical protein
MARRLRGRSDLLRCGLRALVGSLRASCREGGVVATLPRLGGGVPTSQRNIDVEPSFPTERETGSGRRRLIGGFRQGMQGLPRCCKDCLARLCLVVSPAHVNRNNLTASFLNFELMEAGQIES